MVNSVVPADVAKVRAFNRFFTNRLGLLRSGLVDSPWSLTEARILYELAQTETVEVADLRQTLDIDAGQLSRVLGRLADDGLVDRHTSPADRRRQVAALTVAGLRAAALLDGRSTEQTRERLARLRPADQRRLVGAMATVRELFDEAPSEDRPAGGRVELRCLRPGDLGWVVQRHGAIYFDEYGWDERFEALVAQVVADYARTRDPKRENAWIAELDGERAGCVFCVRADDSTAMLRLLLVESSARGHGIGAALVEECLAFARTAGYQRITLWTNDCLHAARRIYQQSGFELTSSEPHHHFGRDLTGQTWERDL